MTREQEFETPLRRVLVPFMRGTLRATYHQERQFSAISLPYAGSTLEMVLVLPDKDVALRQVEEMISEPFIDRVVRNDMFKPLPGMSAEEVRRRRNFYRKSARCKVEVEIPRFEFKMRHGLVGPLCEMGLGVAFSDMADFSRLAEVKPGDLYVSDAEQVVKIKVDEEGTEAAAATYTEVRAECAGMRLPPPLPQFIADHPFVFVLWDGASGAILFMGRVTDPAE